MEDLINRVLDTVPTYKDYDSLIKIAQEASKLKIKSKVLILGPGQGAEAIVIKKMCPSCSITVVDKWNEWIDRGLMNTFGLNLCDSFIGYCEVFNVNIEQVITDDVFKSEVLSGLGKDWDFIYYDCRDNKQGDEYKVIMNMLKHLWSMLNDRGLLMGDDYRCTKPDFAMAPIVNSFFYDTEDAIDFDFNGKGESLYWIVRKHG